jgi:phage terminase large subunit GpA-like protein
MRERNEAVDAKVCARAAASRIGIDRFQEKHWAEFERRVGAPRTDSPPQPKQAPARQPRSQVRFKLEI